MSLRILVVCAMLVSAQIAHADAIRLKGGDEIHGEIVEVTADTVVLVHPELGRLTIARDKIEGDLKHAPSPGLFGTNFMHGWKRRIDLGLNGSQGTTISANATGGLNFNYKDKDKQWLLTGRYFFQRNKEGTTANNAEIALRRDWLMRDSRWFAYGTVRYQYDQFQSWEHRGILSTGPGYNLLKREKQTLDVRLGPAYTRDFGNQESNHAEILWAMDYTWKPRDRIKITLSNQFYTEIGPDPGEFRNLTSAEWTVRLMENPALDLILGGINEYQSDLEPPDKKNNLRYYTTLGVNF
ncbi:MAG: DUF481 domain-containing protein [Myxococcota bacterium]